MKNYITIAALLVAGTAFANADVVDLVANGGTASFIGRPGSNDMAWSLGGWQNKKSTTVLATDVADLLNKNAGWYWGCGSGNTSIAEYSTGGSIAYSEAEGASFSLTGRPAYQGVYVSLVLDVADLFEGVTNPTALTDISLSFNASGATAGELSVWSIANSTATQIGSSVSLVNSGSETAKSFSAEGLSLTDGKIALLFNTQNQDGGTQITISNVKGTATVIPEPSAFGLLAGLGALALVGARRRRR